MTAQREKRGSRSDHVTPLLRDKLHWLRFQQRITYKLCLTVYKALHTRSPSYIKELVVHAPSCAATARLRSAARPEAQVTLVRLSTGASKLWKSAVSLSRVQHHGTNCLPVPALHRHSRYLSLCLRLNCLRSHILVNFPLARMSRVLNLLVVYVSKLFMYVQRPRTVLDW